MDELTKCVLQTFKKRNFFYNQAPEFQLSHDINHFTLRKGLALCSCKGKVTNMWKNMWWKQINSVLKSRAMTRATMNLITTHNYIESETEHKWIEKTTVTWRWGDSDEVHDTHMTAPQCSSCWHDDYLWLKILVFSLGWVAVATIGWVGKDSLKASLVRRVGAVHSLAAIFRLHL